MLTLRGAVETRVVFISLQDNPPERSLQIAPGMNQGHHASNMWHVVQQKRGTALLTDGTLIYPGAGQQGTIFFSSCWKDATHPQMWWNQRMSRT